MGATITHIVELLVGLACLGLAWALARTRRPLAVGVALVLLIMGCAAAIHAVSGLAA